MSKTEKKRSKEELEMEVLRILTKARSKPRFRVPRERDALIDAIGYGDSDLAMALLAHGVDPNSTGPKGRSALWHAAFWVREEVIRNLVERGAKLPDDVLMGPVHHDKTELVRFLVQHGANVNCVAVYNRYCWHSNLKDVLLTVAIQGISRHKNTEDPELIPIMLIKAGAQINRLAFEHSFCEGYIPNILSLAAGRGYEKTIKIMLAAGADVNHQDTWGGTALFSAAQNGHVEVAKILLAAGAETNIKRKDGATPLSFAQEKGFTELANLLTK